MPDPDRLNSPREAPLGERPAGGWRLAWGLLLIVSGGVAVLMPAVAALATALIFGWLLILGGAGELAYAMETRGEKHFGWKLASSLITLLLGAAILFVPLAGVASLALLVGAFLFTGGIARLVLAFQMKPAPGWGWVLFDGLLSAVLAIVIALSWPQSSLAFIGFLTGFWLIWAGLWRLLVRPGG